MNEKGYVTVKVDQSRVDMSKWMDVIISGNAFGSNKNNIDVKRNKISGTESK